MLMHLTKRTHVMLGGSMLVATMLSPALVQGVFGQRVQPVPIPRSASIFIDPIDGFGPELQKAFLKNDVPLVIVTDKRSADFEITGEIRNATEPPAQIDGSRSRDDLFDSQRLPTRFVSLRIVNLKTMDIAWGYGMTGFPDLPTAAEACAKRLKHEMEHGHRGNFQAGRVVGTKDQLPVTPGIYRLNSGILAQLSASINPNMDGHQVDLSRMDSLRVDFLRQS